MTRKEFEEYITGKVIVGVEWGDSDHEEQAKSIILEGGDKLYGS
jgi:tRNA A37 threonylcarbamoyladenosine biosynthesis protein TsaE